MWCLVVSSRQWESSRRSNLIGERVVGGGFFSLYFCFLFRFGCDSCCGCCSLFMMMMNNIDNDYGVDDENSRLTFYFFLFCVYGGVWNWRRWSFIMVLGFMVVVFDFVEVMMIYGEEFGDGGVWPFWSTRMRGRESWFCISSFFLSFSCQCECLLFILIFMLIEKENKSKWQIVTN